MKLKSFSYKEYQQNSRYWELKTFDLEKINLLVGSNASGKTRILNVISGLSRILLDSKLRFNSGSYNACFENDDGSEINYIVEYGEGYVNHEKLVENKKVLLERDRNGKGTILNMALGEKGTKMKFKIPINELIVLRRDEIQYPYLNDLYNWAANTIHFRFAKDEEKLTLALIDTNKSVREELNKKESNIPIEIFKKATAKYRDKYVQNVIEDFNRIGYNVKKIDTGTLQSIKVNAPIGAKAVGLRVYEEDRDGFTDQNEMSDGMFRALSIIIHYNYYALEKRNLNILIDDIGEGLDFERSTNLITLLIEKSKKLDIQLIMTTNDKFVMNNTDLSYWQIVSRKGGLVSVFNKKNSKKIFDEFRFTGLNNFDFFTTGFFKEGLN